MIINIANQSLPKLYMRQRKECYLDPIREKLIYVTPEETVRQRMISYLINELNVPKEAIGVEEHLSHYGINSKYRADIIVHGRNGRDDDPILIIECKAPDVYLDEKTLNQVTNYCYLVYADYAVFLLLCRQIVGKCVGCIPV